MTNGVKELDMPKEFKSVAEQLKAMYNALKKWPFMMGITIEYSNAIVHAFQKFRAPFSGKIVHIFPEQSAVI